MSTSPSTVSVIIPVHNGEKYLGECIESILAQSHDAIEILVVDNLSSDTSAEIANSYSSVRYFYLAEKGLTKALNFGVSQSNGRFLSFLDADDLWVPDKISAQLKEFDRDPKLDMVFGHIKQFVSPELAPAVQEKLLIRNPVMPGYTKSLMLIRKGSFQKVGLFDEQTTVSDFIDWFMRARDTKLRELMLPQILAHRRIHQNNMGYAERNNRIDYVRVMKRALDRRRRMKET